MPTGFQQGHLPTGILGTGAQWLGPVILSGGWENILLFFSIKGKANTV